MRLNVFMEGQIMPHMPHVQPGALILPDKPIPVVDGDGNVIGKATDFQRSDEGIYAIISADLDAPLAKAALTDFSLHCDNLVQEGDLYVAARIRAVAVLWPDPKIMESAVRRLAEGMDVPRKLLPGYRPWWKRWLTWTR